MRQFRLSTLFWLLLVASLLVAWRTDHQRSAERIDALQSELESERAQQRLRLRML